MNHPRANFAERLILAATIAPLAHDVPAATGWKVGAVPAAAQRANCLPSELQIMLPGEEQVLPEEPEVESTGGGAAAAAAAGDAAEEGAAAAAGATEGAAAGGEAAMGAADAPLDGAELGAAEA